MSKKQRQAETGCLCDSDVPFEECCGPVLEGKPAETAEALMRSRYVAYVRGDETHLLRSWHPRTRPASIEFNREQQWLGLRIKRVEGGGPGDERGVVEFVARFKIGGRGHRLHEVSRFERTMDGWQYVDGDLLE